MVNRKVVVDNIKVHKDGDPVGQGELYWHIDSGSQTFSEQPESNPLKVKDGQFVPINDDTTVSNLTGGETMTIQGTVGDRDPASRNESDSFKHVYSIQDNWGLGIIRDVKLLDGKKFNVTLRYHIENL